MTDLEVLRDASEIVHYNNPQVPLYIVKSDLVNFPNKRASCHWHEDIEIMYILDGHISYNVNGKIIDLNTNDGIIVNSRQLHYGFSKDNTNCDYYCYVFKPAVLFHNSYLYETYAEPIISAQHIPFYVMKKENSQCAPILSLISSLYQLLEEHPVHYELQALAGLYRIWSCWYTLLSPQLHMLNAAVDANINIQKSMIVYIQNHYQQKLTISDIASAGNISRTKCCQLFKKYYNTSPMEYLNSFRLELSTGFLVSGNLSITEIALSCGFNSASYYSEKFLKVKGCTPSEYRKSAVKK